MEEKQCLTFAQSKKLIRKLLGDYRYEHSLNVAKEAVKLARQYGADEEKAQLAGVLHDIMKDTAKQEQLQIFQRFGIILTDLEKSAPKLWHAMAGAAYLEHELGINDAQILSAVRYHTTGRAEMSLLERIVFLSDFISADREYDGVQRLRRLAYENMDKAIVEGLAITIGELTGEKLPVHPDTFAAYNDIVMQMKVK